MSPRRSPQLARIARLLGVEVEQVQGLDDVPDGDLRTLHDQISHTLFAGGLRRFAGIAALSKTLPSPAAAKLAEKFLPPVLAARVCELLEPERARDLVVRLKIGYLADVATLLDPVRSEAVVRALPAEEIGRVAGELFARGEHAVVAEFVNTVSEDALEAALAAATAEDLRELSPLVEAGDRLDRITALLA